MQQALVQIDAEHWVRRLVVLPGDSAAAAEPPLPPLEALLTAAVVLLDVDREMVQLHAGGFVLYHIFLDVKIGYFLIKTEHKLLTAKWLNC